jgi:hypothetical protein
MNAGIRTFSAESGKQADWARIEIMSVGRVFQRMDADTSNDRRPTVATGKSVGRNLQPTGSGRAKVAVTGAVGNPSHRVEIRRALKVHHRQFVVSPSRDSEPTSRWCGDCGQTGGSFSISVASIRIPCQRTIAARVQGPASSTQEPCIQKMFWHGKVRENSLDNY